MIDEAPEPQPCAAPVANAPDAPDAPEGRRSPGPVSPDDLALVLRLAAATLRGAPADADWSRAAGAVDWDCWSTVEHLADDLLAYAAQLGPDAPPLDRYVPFVSVRRFPGGPNSFVYAQHEAGPAGLVQVLEASGALMVAMARTAAPGTRAYHPWGVADPAGFTAMSLVETLVHVHDVALGLGLPWEPPADVCHRTLARLFPDVPLDADAGPWPTLLWATGRADLPGRPRRTDWRWYAEVRGA
ncbi:maleylpyruvate isomerase N-terminal domain-containing protein [Kitasatospora sp. RG8]|uniref:maleylpyruvate isomerase N-terminal domain-containing protein n=1 Tax=Kitasatospora sp. RG8 TaxID=2820815 RepID=UPI001ADF0D82|nr:maleylpyruvate isomerase N-terminal domain-containing protein [Kitasatospora sp. RG8]MBP0453218.1 maleylpyruvate isomerase N-terminal domain-containing protein [Kitasatospora sp. RG8]